MPAALLLPRHCTFSPEDWQILATYWYPVSRSQEVTTKPVAVKLLDQEIVLYRTSGGIAAASDLCVHRGVPLSMGTLDGDHLQCKYHGYCYDHTGRCIHIPAHPTAPIPSKLQLRVFGCEERYGLVWVCLNPTPKNPIPPFPEDALPDYQKLVMSVMPWEAAAGRQMESFCDVAHFAFVHPVTFSFAEKEVPRYEAQATDYGVHVDLVSKVSPETNPNAPVRPVRRIYDIHLPFTARLVVEFSETNRFVVINIPSPVSARKTNLFHIVARNFNKEESYEDAEAFQRTVYGEDREVVERQNPEDLPIDLDEEVHVRADLTSVLYRKQLAAIGLGQSFTT
jgi:vanillate O-demethylase monooxygenase subunit